MVIAALVAPVVGADVGTDVEADVAAGGIVAFPCPPITMGAGAKVLLGDAAGCAVLVAVSAPPQAESTLFPAIAAMPMSTARRLKVFAVFPTVVGDCGIVTHLTPSYRICHSFDHVRSSRRYSAPTSHSERVVTTKPGTGPVTRGLIAEFPSVIPPTAAILSTVNQ